MKRHMVALLVLMLTLAALPGTILAHRPLFTTGATDPETAIEFPNARVSQAAYAKLSANTTHFFTFTVNEHLTFFCQLALPDNHEHQDFAPSLALIGPDLPRNNLTKPLKPDSFPANYGALMLPGCAVKEEFFEPFTQTRYLIRQEYRQQLPPGKYYLAVWHPEGHPGKYALSVGEAEQWSFRDLLSFPVIWFRVHWWFSPLETVAIVVSALIAVLLARRLVRHYR